jgi:hypothetical protein
MSDQRPNATKTGSKRGDALANTSDNLQKNASLSSRLGLPLTPDRSRRSVLNTIVRLVLALLLLILLAAATGRSNIVRIPWLGAGDLFVTQQVTDPRPSVMPTEGPATGIATESIVSTTRCNYDGVQINRAPSGPLPQIGDMFMDHYNRQGGERVFGQPISPPLDDGSRVIQWFERARLELWPEHGGTRDEVQGGLVGVEYTDGFLFEPQPFDVSTPDARFFAETSQWSRGQFLGYWEKNGGLTVFGYPISGEINELLPDGQTYLVQYYQRARLEYHPEQAGSPFEVQIGLLGCSLYPQRTIPQILAGPGVLLPPGRP